MSNTKYLAEFSEEEQLSFSRMRLEELEFSARACGILAAYDIQTVKQLASMDERSVLKLRNCGRRSLNEFKEQLAKLGLCLAAEPPPVKCTSWLTNNTYLVLWHHRYGTDHFLVRAAKPPTTKDVIQKLALAFEPEFRERLDIYPTNKVVDLDKI